MNDVTQYHKLTGTIWQQWLAYGPVLVFATQFRLNEKAKALIRKGERVRGITEILHSYVKIISELIRIGEDVRHAKH